MPERASSTGMPERANSTGTPPDRPMPLNPVDMRWRARNRFPPAIPPNGKDLFPPATRRSARSARAPMRAAASKAALSSGARRSSGIRSSPSSAGPGGPKRLRTGHSPRPRSRNRRCTITTAIAVIVTIATPASVLGFVGPLFFWPYAYSDFVDYTFLRPMPNLDLLAVRL